MKIGLGEFFFVNWGFMKSSASDVGLSVNNIFNEEN